MKKYILFYLVILPLFSSAEIWRVGPTRTYTKPSIVAPLVSAGDTVEIDAATYIGDVCAWFPSNLLLKGVGGKPHLRANGNYALGKGIWVFVGNDITVDNIEFSEAAVPDQNGAGIRLDGNGIKVKNCYFHNNENGILTNNTYNGNVIIDNSEFAYNGDGIGQAHNIYIGHVDSAIVRFCYFHHANVGHELKSRARVNYLLYNRFSNEATGNASREIDLPNGGVGFLIGNVVQQGPNGENGNMVGYGLEGLVNTAPHEIYLINNTFVNERAAGGSFLQANSAASRIKVYNNIFAGNGTPIIFGGASVIIDSLTNRIINNITEVGFVNIPSYNYQISFSSLLINAGTNPGVANNGVSLMPIFQYAHPISFITRSPESTLDIGAYEFSSGVLAVNLLKFSANLNLQKTILQWHTTEERNITSYEIMQSKDGYIFETKAIIRAKNNIINFYEWANDASEGTTYYRLKIISTDESVKYSNIISVINKYNNHTNTKIAITNGKIFFYDLPNDFKNTSSNIKIINSVGALLYSKQIKFENSNNWASSFALSTINGYVVVIVSNEKKEIVIPLHIR
jgi:hypothetical protein